MRVLQFWFPHTAGEVDGIGGDASRTAGSSLPIALASPMVSVGADPEPDRSPPEVVLPGRTRRRFDPTMEIWAAMRSFAPVPIATIAITAATPMTMPSIVRIDRIRFARSDR